MAKHRPLPNVLMHLSVAYEFTWHQWIGFPRFISDRIPRLKDVGIIVFDSRKREIGEHLSAKEVNTRYGITDLRPIGCICKDGSPGVACTGCGGNPEFTIKVSEGLPVVETYRDRERMTGLCPHGVINGLTRCMVCNPSDPRCHAGMDGDCTWDECPQAVDYQTICPLDRVDPER